MQERKSYEKINGNNAEWNCVYIHYSYILYVGCYAAQMDIDAIKINGIIQSTGRHSLVFGIAWIPVAGRYCLLFNYKKSFCSDYTGIKVD